VHYSSALRVRLLFTVAMIVGMPQAGFARVRGPRATLPSDDSVIAVAKTSTACLRFSHPFKAREDLCSCYGVVSRRQFWFCC
jgi:hypothetical protein